MALTCVDIELGQPVGSEERHQQKRNHCKQHTPLRHHAAQRIFDKLGHDECRSHPRGDHIGQRVELFAQFRRHVEQPGRKAIEKIKKNAHANPYSSKSGIAQCQRCKHRFNAAEKVPQRDEVWNKTLNHSLR